MPVENHRRPVRAAAAIRPSIREVAAGDLVGVDIELLEHAAHVLAERRGHHGQTALASAVDDRAVGVGVELEGARRSRAATRP